MVKFLDQSKAVDADVVLMYATAAGATQQTTVLDREEDRTRAKRPGGRP